MLGLIGAIVDSYTGVREDRAGTAVWRDRPALLLAVLLVVVGVQFVSLGLLGEMLARTYHESQDKPIYVIKEEF